MPSKKESNYVGLKPIDFIIDAPQRLSVARTGEEIPVVITAVEERLGGLIAAINSIYSNTKSNVVFHIVALNDTVGHLRTWLGSTVLKNIKYRVLEFDPRVLDGKVQSDPEQPNSVKPLTFARFYLPNLISDAEKAIYVDDDVVVQGDIEELYNTPLKPGHAAAFSEDCDSVSSKVMVRGAGSQYNYLGFLDYKKESIRKLGMKASTCSFNPGVFVANLTEWKRQNITQQLEKWMQLNLVEDLYSRTLAGSVTTPPMLIVFYKKHSNIDPLWHVRHLGSSAGNRYSSQFVQAAKLLHWNGHFKPWGRTTSYSDVWEKWYIPDPSGKFHLIRRQAEEGDH
ncbi:glycosyltransferase 8 domain-containing protein 1 isoform X2 [Latimeria chalumnae]|uniref:glycosyltransferase 8 domain-containing protein 1 isoform X2 n=1 Tax=Latimeria chalumnae TaxID=7897 RepID=UPI00313A7C85